MVTGNTKQTPASSQRWTKRDEESHNRLVLTGSANISAEMVCLLKNASQNNHCMYIIRVRPQAFSFMGEKWSYSQRITFLKLSLRTQRGELWAGTAPMLKKQLRPLVGTLESSGRFSQGSWACILGPVRQLTPHISAELWLNWANFAPKGHLLMYRDVFGCHNWGHSWPQHLGMEARDATKHCTMHKAGLMKIIQSQVSIMPRLSNLDLQEERKEGVIHGFTVCH